MLSRALSLATVTLLVGCFAAKPARAQVQNLEAGKSPSQIFAGTCNACHKSPRGLLKTVPAGSLQGFLRQHYTTSPEMASLLSAFLVSNGAADTRVVGGQGKPGRDAKSEGKPGGPPDQFDRFGRKLRPGAPSQEAAKPEGEPPTKPAAGAQAPIQAAGERGPDGRKLSAKQRLSKRGRPSAEEPPKAEPAGSEAAKEETPKSETAKVEDGKPEAAKPSDEGKSESTKSESAKSESGKVEQPNETGGSETPVLRADPVPPVTPAPATPPAVSAAATPDGAPEPATAAAPPPAVTASAPPLPPVAPAGPPAPPISQ